MDKVQAENAFQIYIKPHLVNPRAAMKWHVYHVNHIDELMYFADAEDTLKHKLNIHNLFNVIKMRMIEHGWEGDGRLQFMWLPSFCFKSGDTSGGLIWHVKQGNNGTSYVVSEMELNVRVDRNGEIEL